MVMPSLSSTTNQIFAAFFISQTSLASTESKLIEHSSCLYCAEVWLCTDCLQHGAVGCWSNDSQNWLPMPLNIVIHAANLALLLPAGQTPQNHYKVHVLSVSVALHPRQSLVFFVIVNLAFYVKMASWHLAFFGVLPLDDGRSHA